MNEIQIATTSEQSYRLISAGVEKETADMSREGCLLTLIPYITWNQGAAMDYDVMPAWSLNALIGLLPNKLVAEDRDFLLRIRNGYVDYEEQSGLGYLECFCDDDNFENVVRMIEYVKKLKR